MHLVSCIVVKKSGRINVILSSAAFTGKRGDIECAAQHDIKCLNVGGASRVQSHQRHEV